MVVNSHQLLCHSSKLPGPAPTNPGELFLQQALNGYKHNPLALRLWSLLVTIAFPETLLFLPSPPYPPITSIVILPFTSEMITISLVDHIFPVPISPKRYSPSFSSLFLEVVTWPWRKAPIVWPTPFSSRPRWTGQCKSGFFPQELIIGNNARLWVAVLGHADIEREKIYQQREGKEKEEGKREVKEQRKENQTIYLTIVTSNS